MGPPIVSTVRLTHTWAFNPLSHWGQGTCWWSYAPQCPCTSLVAVRPPVRAWRKGTTVAVTSGEASLVGRENHRLLPFRISLQRCSPSIETLPQPRRRQRQVTLCIAVRWGSRLKRTPLKTKGRLGYLSLLVGHW
jgi:hypothetical protein